MKADLHIHSNSSYGAIAKPEAILEMASERHIDMIAVTDHDADSSWHAFDKISNKYPVKIIKGQEIKLFNDRFATGELLALFLEQPVKSRNLPDILAEVKAQGGFVSIARPFCSRRGEFRAFDQIDDWSNIAIEIKNGRTHKERDNEMAQEIANILKLPVTAGSDAHTPFEVGNTFIEFDGSSIKDLKEAIQRNDVSVGGETPHHFISIISHIARLGFNIF